MNEVLFKSAVAAISSGDYSESDIKIIKDDLSLLAKKEKEILRKMEKDKNEFAKRKRKTNSELKEIRKEIKEINNIFKKTQNF